MTIPSINIPPSDALLHRASCLAARLHQHQIRKDGITGYISHLQRVALLLCYKFGCNDPVVLAAGLLHDAIEDTTADFDEIAETVDPEVAVLVAALTKDMRRPENEREMDYDQRLTTAPWQAKLIKLADVYDNLCDSAISGVQANSLKTAQRALVLSAGEPNLASAAEHLRQLMASMR